MTLSFANSAQIKKRKGGGGRDRERKGKEKRCAKTGVRGSKTILKNANEAKKKKKKKGVR